MYPEALVTAVQLTVIDFSVPDVAEAEGVLGCASFALLTVKLVEACGAALKLEFPA